MINLFQNGILTLKIIKVVFLSFFSIPDQKTSNKRKCVKEYSAGKNRAEKN